MTDADKLTERALWELGFSNKYKSVHRRWNIGGFDIHQASDDDDGTPIPEKEEFTDSTFQNDVKTVGELKELYFKATGKALEIDPKRAGTEIQYW